MALATGARLGPYEIVAPLGAGGMGEVYRGRDPRLGREVAIKVLPEHLARDPEALARFERESRAVAALSHPNILAIFDVGAERDIHFAVTELLEGETLRSRVTGGTIPWRKAIELGLAVAEGLAAAHAKGITHRDIKPENIFVTSDGRVKILDFGLARVGTPMAVAETALVAETEAGTVMGTVGYMSPEQVRGESAGAPSDIFSLGCVLYEMLAGRRAFAKESPPETLTAILRESPPELAGSGREIPLELERLVQHCLEKNPQERFQSARDLAFNLKAILTGSRASKPTSVRPAAAAIDSLAVLPFVNASGSPDTDYLSDGVTESLINSLSQLSGLRIVPRSRVFRYKGQDIDPKKVGRQLKVRALLMGRVMQRGDMLSVQAELVDVTAEAQLWGERFQRKTADIFQVEEEIARQITDKLRVKLSGEEQQRLGKRYTDNGEAYQLYLKGRHHFGKRIESNLRTGIEFFQKAIELDPTYALAYSGLADSYMLLCVVSAGSGVNFLDKAKAAASRALAIDDELAEAHASLGLATACRDYDWRTAEKEFQRAIELNPGYWQAHTWYAIVLAALGRIEEAIRAVKQGREAEPLSLPAHHHASMVYCLAHQYDQIIEECRKAFEIDPTYAWGHFWLGFAREQRREYESSLPELQKAVDQMGATPFAVCTLAHAYAVSGDRQRAEKILEELLALSPQRYVDPFDMALIYTGLDMADQAFAALQKAYEDRSLMLALFASRDPRLDPLRSDPRFGDLLRRIGLPP